MSKKRKIFIVLCVVVFFVVFILPIIKNDFDKIIYDKTFSILSNPDNKVYMDELVKYGRQNNINVEVSYADDLEAMDVLKEEEYDALWMSNSIWLYMLDGVKVINSKSISVNPVVMGIKKSKAETLGFVDNNIYNRDIMNAIKDGKLKYVMTSVTKTNTGLTAYLGFLNSLAGSPEILSMEMLDNEDLKNNLKSLFSGVERVSGSDTFLEDMFLSSDSYEAVIASESSLININKELVSNNKEPLYLLYPVDGVAINDSPFAYIDHDQNKLEQFNKLQSYLLSNESQKKLQELGKRTWYGGINSKANKDIFNPSWGINTSKYLIPLKYPSKDVMNKALAIYIDELRKPSSVTFCLDYSGSMYGSGEEELKNAMKYILNKDEASKDLLQFSENDLITVIPFNSYNYEILKSKSGTDTIDLIHTIEGIRPGGGTNIYDCAIEALNQVDSATNDYTKTVILMTDGESNTGSYQTLAKEYKNHKNIPIYSIMFGNSNDEQLNEIARLTNAKVFDGKTSLIRAFKEVRSYN